MLCGKEVERVDIEYVELGKHFPQNMTVTRENPQTGEKETHALYRAFYSCADCAMKERLAWYKLNYEIGRENIEKIREENNLFRTLMTRVETMATTGEKGREISIRSYISQHRPGWEALPIDTLLLFLDLYQKHAAVFAEIINKKASKDEIKAHLEKKTETSKKQHTEVVEKARIAQNDGLKGTYTADEKKAVKSLMKAMRCSEEVAYNHIQTMMKMAQEKKG
jgi:hypothetical protein